MMFYEQIRESYRHLGYKFKETELGLNLYGFRSRNSQSNQFDDKIGCAWKQGGKGYVYEFNGTTDPGKYWLQNPMKQAGCAILVPGQYLDVYEKGLHAGKYDAFKQCAKMAYVRDNDKNTELDFSLYRDPEKAKTAIFWDIIGSNLHRASEWQVIQWVEKYSASCQVIQDPKNFKKLIDLRNNSMAVGHKKWDYTLFEE
jgi:hypothetical protein